MDDKLDGLRISIDIVDKQLLDLLFKRFLLTDQMMRYKVENKIKLSDYQREAEVILLLRKKYAKLPKGFVQDLYQLIFQYSKKQAKKFR